MHWRPSATPVVLKERAALLNRIRRFFADKDVMEVNTPVLMPAGATDPSIINITAVSPRAENSHWYLHTSPELPMKRLLAAGSGPIYQVCPVFRGSDLGRYHRPEFSLLEWYRPDYGYHQLMDEVECLLIAVMPSEYTSTKAERVSYRDIFLRVLEIDPFQVSVAECRECCDRFALSVPDNMGVERDIWLDLLMSMLIAPKLPQDRFTFIYDYPASQAALAKTRDENGRDIAERFELYWGELELANGFQELTDPDEQLQRFEAENRHRLDRKLPTIAIDYKFIECLRDGMPESSGVALGLDRLLMVLTGARHINEVVTFTDEI